MNYLLKNEYDLVLLDLMLPGLSGENLIYRIRDLSTMPVIIISVKMDMDTKLKLLKDGADDFIEKPFEIEEVLVRVEARLRQYMDFSTKMGGEELGIKNLKLIKDERRVTVKVEYVKLTGKEFDILELLLSYPDKVFSKSNLYDSILGENSYMDYNTLNVHISNIRNKIFNNKVNLRLERGEIYGLVGENGSGKSTLIKMIVGIRRPTSGEITIYGESTEEGLNKGGGTIGSIVESPALFSYFSARKNLEYFRRQRGINDKAIIDEVLELVNLTNTGNKKFKDFPLGMKQRLGIAQAIMLSPEIFILDDQ